MSAMLLDKLTHLPHVIPQHPMPKRRNKTIVQIVAGPSTALAV